MKSGVPVTVVIPYHDAPDRASYLARAIESIAAQSVLPQAVIVETDILSEGAAVTRNRGLQKVTTPLVTFLDSDDFMLPNHLEVMFDGGAAQQAPSGLGFVYSYFMGVDQFDGFIPDDPLGLYGHAFDTAAPTQTTSVVMVETGLAQAVGFHDQPTGKLIPGTNQRHGEDYQFTLDCVALGARPLHIPVRTWAWRFWPGNSSGRPTR